MPQHRSAWLVVGAQVQAYSEKPTVLAGHLKHTCLRFMIHDYVRIINFLLLRLLLLIIIIQTQGLSNNTRTHHCCKQWLRTHHSTPHTLWGCAVELASALAAAIILADAIATPPSPK